MPRLAALALQVQWLARYPCRRRHRRYYEYVWVCHRGLFKGDRATASSDYFFAELPEPLRLRIASFMHQAALEKVSRCLVPWWPAIGPSACMSCI